MNYEEAMAEHLSKMLIKGLSPNEVYNRNRENTRKKYQRQKEQSIFEKEMFNFIQAMVFATVNKSINDIFKDWQK